MDASTNANEQEIRKFSDAASRWWDPDGEFQPLHAINPLRLGYIQRHAHLDGRDVLDVGCGGGILTEALAGCGARVTGIDLSAESLEVARLHALETGAEITYRDIAVEDLAREVPGSFDVVTCMELLEHVPDPESVVAACTRLVRPGGHLFFSTLNRTRKSWLFAIVGAEYVLGLLPRGTHDHARFIRPSELAAWCRHAGAVMDDLTGLTYNPVSREYRLTRDTGVNYLAHCTRTGDA
ncbi:bifunctional 2-polyprenyl-6-hydroxyphenol methylase/3-demethylubiquinol 3-O-methyltransferase UbiG [Aquisalimonas lutea]|uniref:bifunctional 2-polyprenyl-6-hydroxyphenol methylase/3-demethylubiquinol 3-O-methyltransferase UbiG n=1 Tax=Aquisalimonas lutea TaxID=1327750 RepID=UPI0025B43278|nr:bifunctional 2-polyprenyl-6-hydroxyphenol methylase/3-demethylubiquinol 3-O-methyltransferase UbiG [Aquisalimonas lutea]MDN3517666.1 bifunctional 2-polyprenyl-6-hydroxyphenol methylase/3-demethylubiquinol 3-O-methyltransferase UbiG [Aquisalimonas lutea]